MANWDLTRKQPGSRKASICSKSGADGEPWQRRHRGWLKSWPERAAQVAHGVEPRREAHTEHREEHHAAGLLFISAEQTVCSPMQGKFSGAHYHIVGATGLAQHGDEEPRRAATRHGTSRR